MLAMLSAYFVANDIPLVPSIQDIMTKLPNEVKLLPIPKKVIANYKKTKQVEDIVVGNLLGSGNYCKVYSANWKGNEVAIKSIDLGGEDPDRARGMLKNEIEIMQHLDHPNVLQCCKAGLGYFIMDRLAEGDLHHYLHAQPATTITTPLDPRLTFIQKLEIARQISQGMEYLHSKNVIHADLHTANILV